MKLEIWHEGLNNCIDHINQLREDGDLLINKGSFSHAYFFYYTAIEELATANYILGHFNYPSPKDLKKIIYSHEKKKKIS